MHKRLRNGEYSSAFLQQLFWKKRSFIFSIISYSTPEHSQIFQEQTDVC